MNFSLIPLWLRLVLVAVALTALTATGGWVLHAYEQREARLNEIQREIGRKEVIDKWNRAVEQENQRQRAIQEERDRKQLEADHAHTQDLAAANADAAGARDAAARLQVRVAALVAAARRGAGSPGPAAGQRPGEQGADPIGVLADMQRRTDEAAGRIGQYADALRVAGLQCERFDALNADPKGD